MKPFPYRGPWAPCLLCWRCEKQTAQPGEPKWAPAPAPACGGPPRTTEHSSALTQSSHRKSHVRVGMIKSKVGPAALAPGHVPRLLAP